MLLRIGDSLKLIGPHTARLFCRGEAPRELESGSALDDLLAL